MAYNVFLYGEDNISINDRVYSFKGLLKLENKSRIELQVLKLARIYFRIDLKDDEDFIKIKKDFEKRGESKE